MTRDALSVGGPPSESSYQAEVEDLERAVRTWRGSSFTSACFSNETQLDARIPEPAVMFPWDPFGDVTWNSVTSVQWSYFGFLYLYIRPPHQPPVVA